MPPDWKVVHQTIDAENRRLRTEPPEEVVKVFHYSIIDSGAGMDGQAFPTWFFSAADVRYVAAYCYQIVRLARDPSFTLDQLKTMARTFLPQPAEFSGYCGMEKLWCYTQDLLASLDTVSTREDFLELINAMLQYGANLNSWIHHYFKWEMGSSFPRRTKEQVQEMAALVAAEG